MRDLKYIFTYYNIDAIVKESYYLNGSLSYIMIRPKAQLWFNQNKAWFWSNCSNTLSMSSMLEVFIWLQHGYLKQ